MSYHLSRLKITWTQPAPTLHCRRASKWGYGYGYGFGLVLLSYRVEEAILCHVSEQRGSEFEFDVRSLSGFEKQCFLLGFPCEES
ncbi:hypothetical protein V6N13_146520 [Hibiscus sabdariffa]